MPDSLNEGLPEIVTLDKRCETCDWKANCTKRRAE